MRYQKRIFDWILLTFIDHLIGGFNPQLIELLLDALYRYHFANLYADIIPIEHEETGKNILIEITQHGPLIYRLLAAITVAHKQHEERHTHDWKWRERWSDKRIKRPDSTRKG